MSVKITVVPAEFTLVQYEAAEIADVAADVAEKIGFPDGTEVRVEVDEHSPLGKTEVVAIDPVTVAVESGAFEDAKRPRHLSERSVRSVARPAAVLAPTTGSTRRSRMCLPMTTCRCASTWHGTSTRSAVASASGGACQKERRRYHFRIRHGFTDVADAAFDRLWAADGLTWATCRRCATRPRRPTCVPAVKRGRGR